MQAFTKQKQNSALVCNESATRAAVALGLSAVSAQSAARSTHSENARLDAVTSPSQPVTTTCKTTN